MRKFPLLVTALAATTACALAGCSGNLGGHGSAAASGGVGTRTADGLSAFAPSWLRSSCAETGQVGHLPASVAGYSDSVSCVLRVNMPAEVDYYRYATTSDMTAAYDSASASDDANSPQQPGGCAAGRDETGKWSVGGSAVGEIACPVDGGNGVDLIWDDPHTNIIAVASSRHLMVSALYEFWQSNGASIDGSARSAISS